MRNLLVFALLAAVLVSSVAIPSDLEPVKKTWSSEQLAAQNVPPDVSVTQAIDYIDELPESDSKLSAPSSQVLARRVLSVSSKKSNIPLLDDKGIYEQTFEDDLSELEYLHALLKELKYSIREKKQTIAQRNQQDRPSIVGCDGLKCVAKIVEEKTREAVRKLLETVVGDVSEGPPKQRDFNRTRSQDSPNGDSSRPSSERRLSQGIFQSSEDMEKTVQVADVSQESFRDKQSLRRISYALQVFGVGLVVLILTVIIKSVQRLFSTPAQKTARQMRRAECQYRSSVRRAAPREAIRNLLTRLGRRVLPQQDEEKQAAMSDDDALSTTMTEDMAGLMNAVDMVNEIVAAEEGRARRSMYTGSEGESLPVLDGRDDSELGSVADALRYTPGATDYTPSPAGGASDILGADDKQ